MRVGSAIWTRLWGIVANPGRRKRDELPVTAESEIKKLFRVWFWKIALHTIASGSKKKANPQGLALFIGGPART